VDDERSRSAGAVAVSTLQPAGKRAGTRLVVGGDGAAVRLLGGGTGAPFRPRRELGVAATGAGGVAAGSDPAAGAGRQDRGAGSHEVSGAGGPCECGAMRADGGRFRRTPLRHAAGRATVCGLAAGITHGPRTHTGGAGAVFENAAAGAGRPAGRTPTGNARSGNGGRHSASRQPAAYRSDGGDERGATGADGAPDRKRAAGADADGGTNGKGARGQTC